MKAQTLKPNSGDDKKFKELIGAIKKLDSEADEKLRKTNILIKFFTAVRSLFGNFRHNGREVLHDLERGAFAVSSDEVFKTKAENLLIPVTENEVMNLQDKIQITNPEYPKMNLKDAKENGYLPKYKFIYGDVSYYFSDPIIWDQKHVLIFTLVELKGKVYPRVMYLSNSQGTLRVMPAIYYGHSTRFGKGLMETDTQVPIAVMLAMYEIDIDKEKLEDGSREYEKSGVLNNVEKASDCMDYTKTWKEAVNKEEFAKLEEGASPGCNINGMCVQKPENPETIKMPDDKLQPNFSKGPIMEKSLTLLAYGAVTAKLFSSNDGSIQYLFYEVKEDGRVFLATVEKVTENPITNFGVRSKALNLNSMDEPLLDYYRQIPEKYRAKPESKEPTYNGYGYRNNWNYVSNIAIIKKYYEDYTGGEMPEEL